MDHQELFYIRIDLFLKECDEYLEKWIRYTNEIRELKLEWLELKEEIEYFKVDYTMNKIEQNHRLYLLGIDREQLHNEIRIVNDLIPTMVETWKNKKLASHVRWLEVIQKLDIDCPNIYNLLEYFFSIPSHNASVERVFSLIKWYWSASKSKTQVAEIRDFAQVRTNLIDQENDQDLDSCKIYDYIYQDEELCKKIKTAEKYAWGKWGENQNECNAWIERWCEKTAEEGRFGEFPFEEREVSWVV